MSLPPEQHKPTEQDAANNPITEVGDAISASVTQSVSWLQKLWRSFKLWTRIIIYVPLSLLIVVALLLGTEFGSRITVGLANQFIPDAGLTYTSGSINKDLVLSQATWSMAGIKVELEDVHLLWQPACFLQKRLCVNSLSATKVDITIDTVALTADSETVITPQDETPSELLLPFDIVLDSATLNAIHVQVDDMQFAANQLSAQAQWFAEGLSIKQLTSEGLSVFIPTSADTVQTSSATGNHSPTQQNADPTVATSVAAPTPVQVPTIAASTVINDNSAEWALAQLPAVFMPFPVTVHALTLDNTTLQIGERKDAFSHVELQGHFREYQLTLGHLQFNHTDGNADITGSLTLDKDYPLDLEVSLILNQLAELPELTHQALTLHLSQSVGKLQINAVAKGDADLILNGQITLGDPNLPYTVKLEHTRLQWPLKNPEYSINDVTLVSEGDFNQQQATLKGQFTTPFHKVLDIDTQLQNQGAKLTINKLEALGAIGKVDLSGELDYQKAISWTANLKLNDIKLQELQLPKTDTTQTATILPDSLISGTLRTQGSFADPRWQVALSDTALSGSLQGYPFDITGDININDALYVSSKGLNAKVLGATLILKGEANANWDLQGELQVPDFGLWIPKASGQLQAQINVTGDEKHPQVELTALLAEFAYQNIRLQESNLTAYYKPLEQHEFAISLKSKTLQLAAERIDTLTLGAKGTINAQQLTLNAIGDLSLDVTVNSQYDVKKSHLQVDIERLNLNTPVGPWQLDKTVNLAWDKNKNQGSITPFCLINPNSRVCLNNNTPLGNKGNAQISYSGNPGKLLIPILPTNMRWDGPASLLANFAWAANRKPTADVNLDFTPGSIMLKRAKNREVTINYQNLSLRANLDAKQLTTALTFESEGVASWQSEINVNVTPDRALAGYANIKQINLQPLGEFFPQLNTVQGLLTSQLNFAGSLDAPEVSGSMALTEGALALTANPTLVDKIDMSMTFAGQQAQLKGRWMMGNGLGRVNGQLQWPQGQFSGELAVQGDKLAVIQPPLAILDVSPDITVTFSSKQLAVKGQINVPSGNIKIIPLAEGGVATSEDVVFEDSIAATQPKTSPYAIVADLNINVGNELRIDGMGLKGKLQGTLRLQQQAFRPPLLFGNIKVNQGSYKFMGQTLKIRTGEVQFVGPTSVPNLNIEAIREIKSEDLVAGVRVTGTPSRPVVTLFSNPAKEQAEILSYIVKGSGFNNANNEQNNSLMMGAALGLSSQVSGGAINSIGNTATGLIEEFGFSNVQLDTNDEGRVAISGYIGEDLMVKYGVGVFNPGYEMTVRYYLLSQLYLETVSGTLGQSLDIYYNFNIK
ncbi:translocation/assembly module TamB domain-containing protein [Shewanella glacialipiscicola]|uniref:autotransporter assembly complex protein TamB n=1 Tax=Shewanella glacialipiscicola TaxID=614069 RepID=UPI0021DAE49C|nr:translocation/assembly module TamB domain-containing protein [Shewanella glacialipiscicola]MCU7993505.1 translocation/assembly module TamB domain-containing protein [Shewanella glacialipiscicola]MCU8024822.1 translocation/assembly module TamB domain-containing protein [Shewanella glacialipiscicola]